MSPPMPDFNRNGHRRCRENQHGSRTKPYCQADAWSSAFTPDTLIGPAHLLISLLTKLCRYSADLRSSIGFDPHLVELGAHGECVHRRDRGVVQLHDRWRRALRQKALQLDTSTSS